MTFLFELFPPWISLKFPEPEASKWIPSHFYVQEARNCSVVKLRGRKMQTTEALMNEISAAFQFFDGFGENWDALEECLSYLDEWMKAEAYVVLFTETDQILVKENKDQLAALLKTLDECGKWWSKPITDNGRFNRGPIPFHSLFFLPSHESKAVTDRFLAAAELISIKIDISNELPRPTIAPELPKKE